MKRIRTNSFARLTRTFFRRFHLTVFIVCIVAGLSYAVISFSELLDSSSADTGYTSAIDAGSIDQATLERINNLHESDSKTTTLITPAGRINPFTE
jgi:hypothetical protein